MAFHSNVGIGSGVSSSASLSCAIATALNNTFNDGKIPKEDVVDICQAAEHNYMGKKCGRMDQTASLWGDLLYVEFPDAKSIKPSVITKEMFDLEKLGYSFVVVDTGGSHADLDDAYSQIPADMKFVASLFGASVLSEARRKGMDEASLEKLLSERKINLRQYYRAKHNIFESKRVNDIYWYLRSNNTQRDKLTTLLMTIKDSGISSMIFLDNLLNPNFAEQDMANQQLADGYIKGREFLAEEGGAVRLMGGGFAGTTLALVPNDLINLYLERVGKDKVAKVYNFRPGAGRVEYS